MLTVRYGSSFTPQECPMVMGSSPSEMRCMLMTKRQSNLARESLAYIDFQNPATDLLSYKGATEMQHAQVGPKCM